MGAGPIGRRAFLTALGGATLSWPRALDALDRELSTGGAADDEAFWGRVRGEFLIPPDRIYLNNGTLGPSPRVVVEAVAEHTRRVAATYPPGVSWEDLTTSAAGFLGGAPEGFVFPRNTTEATSFVANGIELGPGDVVLTTDHEHMGGLEPWRMVTRRRGATLEVVSLPVPAERPDDLLDAVWAGVRPDTRVIAVSHMTFTTGTVLPVAELAARCRTAGIVLAVDGAHPPGMLAMELDALGGDFYASSPHKWLLAPQGTGMLYLHGAWRDELWPTLASGGWDDPSLGAHRLNHMGTVDESRLAGLLSALKFFHVLGAERVEARIRHLRRRLEGGLADVPGLRLVTPTDEALKGGMVAFALDGVESAALQHHLSAAGNVRTRVVGEYDYGWMRLSTHVYNTPRDIERTVELLQDAARRGLPSGAGAGDPGARPA